MSPRPLLILLLAAGALGGAGPAWCQSPGPTAPPETTGRGLGSDIKLYFTAPLRWDRGDWAWFGGALIAIGASHHYDTQVRTHFIKTLGSSQTTRSKDLQDALPTSDSAGRREAWAMIESAALSTVPVYALKYAVGRERPDQTSDPNAWRKGGGDSFPSWHATAAFAVGTVLAESGNDDYRWVRRLLGYGLGGVTSFERLKHNAHWLSDTVAGAALGAASAHFVMKRANALDEQAQLRLVPIERGAMLSYTLTLR
ncbi:MAG: phosphatase PAP2 family protein [Gammaproteobacteria bacterium]|nr:MAG: phosphatase PAP2 family protein [Gammaproteobacteria bacterium]